MKSSLSHFLSKLLFVILSNYKINIFSLNFEKSSYILIYIIKFLSIILAPNEYL